MTAVGIKQYKKESELQKLPNSIENENSVDAYVAVKYLDI